MSLKFRLPALICGATILSAAVPFTPSFEPNWGQADPSTAFLAHTPEYTLVLRNDGTVAYRFSRHRAASAETVHMEVLGHRGPVDIAGQQPLSSVLRYYRGNKPGMWHRIVPQYRNVHVGNIYPGIDMVWQARGSGLEYDFVVSAGADPRRIQLAFRGASRIWINSVGDLVLETGEGSLYHRKPVAWQEIDGRRVSVNAWFRVDGGSAGFELGPFDRSRVLWIDPVLSYSAYLGGGGHDVAYAVAADAAGRTYITGTTDSVSFSPGSPRRPNCDAFVTKFNADGSIAYTTILSSSGDDYGFAIAVDAAGNAYVAGIAGGADFPATPGAWQTESGGNGDAFAAKLDANGNLVYASFIGGTGDDSANGIAVDQQGNAYVAGYTDSVGFPTTPGAARSVYAGGDADAFLIKLNPPGNSAVYAALLGGSGNDQAWSVALSPAGGACIAGYTDSTDLPVQSAPQSSPGGQGDGMVACLSAAGDAWTMVSYLGGSGGDEADSLAVDGVGNVYVAGTTFSWDFPATAGAFRESPVGDYDAFVVKLTPLGGFVYSTLLGGSLSDTAAAIVAGSSGDIWVAGFTWSMDFPVSGAWQLSNRGSSDGFLAHLSPDGSTLLASSYLGGSQEDGIWGLALGLAGQLIVAGSTASADFPAAAGTAGPIGDESAFIARIDPSLTAFSISGQVTVSGVAPLSGLRVLLSGSASNSTTTDASGNYIFSGVPAAGSYTVAPSGGSYSFSPSGQSFGNLSADQKADFTATCGLTVDPAAVFFDSASHAGPPLFVTAPSDCLWVASAGGDFINITSGTNGMGNGVIGFSMPANSTGSALSGNLRVDNQVVSITQRATATTFADVAPSGFYFDGANLLYSRGITGGCSASPLQYCPNDNMTRGQMAVFIVASIEGNNQFNYTTSPYFTDVPPTHPFFKFIQRLRDLGITSGCSSNRFCPDAPITRGQMAVFIIAARYGTVPYSYPADPYFTDVTPANPFFRFIQKMAQVGITAGCGAGLYCPDAALTRGQMAVFIATGLLNQLLGNTPLVRSATPASASPGQVTTLTVSGSGTHFVQGTTQVWAAPGITPSNVAVTSSTSLTVQVSLSTAAALGPSSIVVTTGTEEAVLPNGFRVQ